LNEPGGRVEVIREGDKAVIRVIRVWNPERMEWQLQFQNLPKEEARGPVQPKPEVPIDEKPVDKEAGPNAVAEQGIDPWVLAGLGITGAAVLGVGGWWLWNRRGSKT